MQCPNCQVQEQAVEKVVDGTTYLFCKGVCGWLELVDDEWRPCEEPQPAQAAGPDNQQAGTEPEPAVQAESKPAQAEDKDDEDTFGIEIGFDDSED